MSKKDLKAWKWFLIVTGILTAIAIVYPGYIIVGLFLFVIPGLILLAAPSVFFYSISLTGLIILLRPVGEIRWQVAPLLLLFAALLTPYIGNIRTLDRVQEFREHDIEGAIPVKVRDTIALVERSFSYYHRDGDHYCNSLCQRLLYDGVAEKVLIGRYKTDGENNFRDTVGIAHFPATAYFIEKRDGCPIVPEVLRTVSQRIATGECLVRAEATLAEAETLYVSEQLTSGRRYAVRARYNLGVAAVNAAQRAIIEKTEEGYQTLYQKTQTTAEPLQYPLLLTGIGHGGGNLGMSLGFRRDHVVHNNLQGFEYKTEQQLFGVMRDAVRVPADENGAKARALVLKALRSKGPEKQAGHDFFPHYLAMFARRTSRFTQGRDLTPSKQDIDMVVMALRDDRVSTGFQRMWSFKKKLKSIPDELVVAMADRILRAPDQEDMVQSLSALIGSLPDGKAAVISGQILQMLENKKLMPLTSEAIARLGDGEPRAAQHYVAALQTWRSNQAAKSWRRTDETPNGPLVGLCRLGEEARAVKDDLLLIYKDTNYSLLSSRFVRALLRMGAEEDLKREFEQTERWPLIEDTIAFKTREGALSKEFCDP